VYISFVDISSLHIHTNHCYIFIFGTLYYLHLHINIIIQVITGGFELALACDILLGDSTTQFRDTHVKFGLAPCWGLSQNLSRRIGPGRAKLVSFTAQPILADKAYEWGLLDELVMNKNDPTTTTDPVLQRAMELAEAISSNNALMVRRYKRAIVEGAHVNYFNGLQRERELGLAHYIEIVGDGMTFESAKEYIIADHSHQEDGQQRQSASVSQSKL
jgi:enoyl-CoA hydratase/carnithine racemase